MKTYPALCAHLNMITRTVGILQKWLRGLEITPDESELLAQVEGYKADVIFLAVAFLRHDLTQGSAQTSPDAAAQLKQLESRYPYLFIAFRSSDEISVEECHRRIWSNVIGCCRSYQSDDGLDLAPAPPPRLC